ncbi:MAG: hypothetical protein ACE5KF_05500 [Kiloniellaceae bacterium]
MMRSNLTPRPRRLTRRGRNRGRGPNAAAHRGPAPRDSFAAALAEALDLLAERARRHGLGEAAHFLDTAALSARQAAGSDTGEDDTQAVERADGPSFLA